MSIDAPWWVFADVIIASEQELPGVYELGNAAGEVIYIGSSANIRRRLRQHWVASGDSCVKRHATQYRVEYRSDYRARERELYDLHVRRYAKPPLCGGDVDASNPAPAWLRSR
jgi:predicted GIY-YIG superfamily endonuclease